MKHNTTNDVIYPCFRPVFEEVSPDKLKNYDTSDHPINFKILRIVC